MNFDSKTICAIAGIFLLSVGLFIIGFFIGFFFGSDSKPASPSEPSEMAASVQNRLLKGSRN